MNPVQKKEMVSHAVSMLILITAAVICFAKFDGQFLSINVVVGVLAMVMVCTSWRRHCGGGEHNTIYTLLAFGGVILLACFQKMHNEFLQASEFGTLMLLGVPYFILEMHEVWTKSRPRIEDVPATN